MGRKYIHNYIIGSSELRYQISRVHFIHFLEMNATMSCPEIQIYYIKCCISNQNFDVTLKMHYMVIQQNVEIILLQSTILHNR